MFFKRFEALCKKNGSDVSNTLRGLGLSTSKGTAWRNGSIPNGEVILKLAHHFNVSTDYLLGNTDDPQPAGQTPSEDIKLSPQEQRLIEMYRELNDEGQDVVTSFLDTMLMSGKYKKYNKLNLGTKEA